MVGGGRKSSFYIISWTYAVLSMSSKVGGYGGKALPLRNICSAFKVFKGGVSGGKPPPRLQKFFCCISPYLR